MKRILVLAIAALFLLTACGEAPPEAEPTSPTAASAAETAPTQAQTEGSTLAVDTSLVGEWLSDDSPDTYIIFTDGATGRSNDTDGSEKTFTYDLDSNILRRYFDGGSADIKLVEFKGEDSIRLTDSADRDSHADYTRK